MRPAAVLCIALLLTGCLAPEAPGVSTLRLDVPPPADLLPPSLEGHALGLETPISTRDAPFPRLVDGHTRLFDPVAQDGAVQTIVSAMRFEDEAAASDAIARIAVEIGARPEATRPALGDEAIQIAVPSDQGSSILAVRKGPVLWMVQHAPMRPGLPAPELAPIVEPYLARVG